MQMFYLSYRYSLILILIFLLTACSPFKVIASMSSINDPKADPPKQNPNPQEAYKIKVIINNPPGDFNFIHPYVQYDVINHNQCGQKVNENDSPRYRMLYRVPIQLIKTASNEYEGIFYFDGLMDEDYFGNGVCHWQLSYVFANFKATGLTEETLFTSDIKRDFILNQLEKTQFYWNKSYPMVKDFPNYKEFGYESIERFKPEMRNDLFNIKLITSKVQP